MIPKFQTSTFHREDETEVPQDSALIVSTIGVTGFTFAKTWSHDGIVSIGTYKELAKTRGNTQTKPAT